MSRGFVFEWMSEKGQVSHDLVAVILLLVQVSFTHVEGVLRTQG